MNADPKGTTTDHAARREVLLARRMVELTDTLVDDFDLIDLLDTLVHSCIELLPASESGLLLLDMTGRLEVMASTSEATRIIELLQLHNEAGPCFECVQTGEVVSINDLATDHQRWPQFAASAMAVGYHSVHAIPMRLRDQVIGGLNLFSGLGPSLSTEDRKVAQALADLATIGILQQRSIHRVSLVAEQLQTALSTRVIIEQAKGLLAEYGQVDMDVAFTSIRSYARNHNLKLSLVADQLVQRSINPSHVLPKG